MAEVASAEGRSLPSPRGCTERVRGLRQEILAAPWEICIERARCYTEVYQSSADEPVEVKRALALRHTLEQTPIRIYDGELLVDHWHRVGFVVDMSAGGNRIRKFIDGQMVGEQRLGGVDGRWSLRSGEGAILFGDEEGQALVAGPPPGSVEEAYRSPLEQ